jgi:MFS family permease
MLALLRHEPRARLFLAAHAQSTLGTGAGVVALLLIAYDRFRSPWAITFILLADFLPAMLLGPVFGALADRLPRRRAAVAADLARAAAFIGLGFVGGFGATVALALLAGAGTGLFRPAVMAALPSLASRERLPALTAGYGALEDVGYTAGPALAAAALLVVSPEALLLANGVTFAASALVLARLDFGARAAAPAVRPSLAGSMREGLRAIRGTPGVATIVLASSSVVLFAGLFNVGELLLASDELGAGAAGFSALVAVYGAGAVLGSVAGSRTARLRRGYVFGFLCLGTGMLAAGLAPGLAPALAAFALAGAGNGLVVVHERLLLQRAVPDSLLGRVFGLKDSLSSWAFGAAFLCAGMIAALVGTRELFLLAGSGALAVCLLAALSFRSQRTPVPAHGALPPLRAGIRAPAPAAIEPLAATSERAA